MIKGKCKGKVSRAYKCVLNVNGEYTLFKWSISTTIFTSKNVLLFQKIVVKVTVLFCSQETCLKQVLFTCVLSLYYPNISFNGVHDGLDKQVYFDITGMYLSVLMKQIMVLLISRQTNMPKMY
jgi:hypothetical protein